MTYRLRDLLLRGQPRRGLVTAAGDRPFGIDEDLLKSLCYGCFALILIFAAAMLVADRTTLHFPPDNFIFIISWRRRVATGPYCLCSFNP